VHLSNLIRVHEEQTESDPDYPNKIHWGKFGMIGTLVHSIITCQMQCRNTKDYNFKENSYIRKLMQHRVMDMKVCVGLSSEVGSANKFHRCKGHALLLHLKGQWKTPLIPVMS
jgi:hypothetical protein